MGNPYLDRLAAGGKNPHGNKSEKRVAKELGARHHSGSGASRGKKSDASTPDYRFEMKSTTSPEMKLEMAWLVKITHEALAHSQLPVVVISFVDDQGKPRLGFGNGDWVVIPKNLFQELTDSK